MSGTRISLSRGIKEFIFKYRCQAFLKQNNKPFSGDAFQRVEEYINNDLELLEKFKVFIADELSSSKNRQIFWCDFSIESLRILGSSTLVKQYLRNNNLPFENFNHALTDDEDIQAGKIVYLNIESVSDETTRISMSIKRPYDVQVEDEDRGIINNTLYDYDWIDIFPRENYLLIKTRPINNYLSDQVHSSNIFNYYQGFLKQIFGISYLSMNGNKETLYNIFKLLTDRAEASYRKKTDDLSIEIEKCVNDLSQKIGLKNFRDPVDIPNRVGKLFERALILEDIDEYMSYQDDKYGIVERIDFSDQSGAKVNALSQNEGIEIADIYFDTRETLDEQKQLNKLWIKWFLRYVNTVDSIETKIEVTNERIIILFQNVQMISKEDQDYVLSLFKQFKEGEIS
jgi:hypothetical protein